MSIFDLEVKEKKRQAFLNKARTGAKGGSKSRKGMSTPYDYMNKKEKEKLNGEVETFNMNETILPYEEFRLKDESLQKMMLTRWREIYDNMKIRTELGISNKAFYDLVAELGIPKKPRVENTGRVGRPKTVKPEIKQKELPKKNLLELVEEAVKEDALKLQEKPAEVLPVMISQGITFNYDQISDIETLNRILTKCQLLMEDEPHKFQLKISLSEIIGN